MEIGDNGHLGPPVTMLGRRRGAGSAIVLLLSMEELSVMVEVKRQRLVQ